MCTPLLKYNNISNICVWYSLYIRVYVSKINKNMLNTTVFLKKRYDPYIVFHHHCRYVIVITAICCICSRYAQWFVSGLRTGSDKQDWGYHGAVHLAIAAREAGQTGRTTNTYTATMCTQMPAASTTMTCLCSITITTTDTLLLTGVAKRPAVNYLLVNLATSFNMCLCTVGC